MRRRGLAFAIVTTATAYALLGDFVTSHESIPAPPLARPAVGKTYVDPEFGLRITRLTDSVASKVRGQFPYYSKRQSFNADETLLLLADGDGGWRIFDATTLKLVRGLPELDLGRTETFWHPTDPNTLIFRANGSDDSAFRTLNVATKQVADLFRIEGYDAVTTTDEGNLSDDGHALALLGETYFPEVRDYVAQDLLLVDPLAGTTTASIGFPAYDSIDWVGASPSGKYVVLDYVPKGEGSHSIAVYDSSLNPLRAPVRVGEGHSDLGMDGSGAEYLVIDLYDFASNSHKLTRVDLATGAQTTLLSVSFASDFHFSCVNTADRDWCFVSSFDDEYRTKPTTADWFPFEDEIFAVKVDGSGEVRRFAHHESRAWYAAGKKSKHTYEAEPHATVSRSGTRIVFGSNWSLKPQSVSSVDAYVFDLRASAGKAADFSLAGPDSTLAARKTSGVVELTASGDGPFKITAAGGPSGVSWSPKTLAATPGAPVSFTWRVSKKASVGNGFATFVVSTSGGRARILSVPFTVY